MGLQGYVGSAEDQARIRRLEREREANRARVEAAKRATANKPAGFRQWQAGSTEVLESAFKKETVGLVTREEYVEKRKTIGARLEAEAVKRKRADEADAEAMRLKAKAQKERQRKAAKLSFADDEGDGDDAEGELNAVRLRKDEDVRTDFLPDTNREREKERLQEQLKEEWEKQQEKLKEEEMEVPYSYWDGSGHQRVLTVKVGDTIADFLKNARNQLAQDFTRLRHISIPNLMFVKDGIIVPQAMTFYELIIGKVHRKGVLLYSIEDESKMSKMAHSAKVVERRWYESSKHIYPASQWRNFDADKHLLR